MAAIPVLRFRVKISPAGGFIDIITANGNFPNLSISGGSLAAVIAILNGRSPTYDPSNNGFSSTGGVGHEATEHIIALNAGGELGGNNFETGEGHIF
ncbi:hypothetical protein [Spirosoma radiotolerans]|uniref:Uncharacterized protein n=1 Tax=Spirosoma radiotolerans TaxID=1379870 RepID=A0A0E3V999_9BACT|nr:hypothetical protein [Spirosoma radiotolerans]AKD56956.1 hypothetical protein SD10_20665 [Spirosoma radiotolerans]